MWKLECLWSSGKWKAAVDCMAVTVYGNMWALYESIRPLSPWYQSKEFPNKVPSLTFLLTHAAFHISIWSLQGKDAAELYVKRLKASQAADHSNSPPPPPPLQTQSSSQMTLFKPEQSLSPRALLPHFVLISKTNWKCVSNHSSANGRWAWRCVSALAFIELHTSQLMVLFGRCLRHMTGLFIGYY